MRFIGLDVHRDFCEVAIADEDGIRSAGRVETTPGSLRLFAASLAADDQVALEATGNALAIAAILRPHVGRVALANPAAVRGELNAPKTDRVDARALARLLATGFLPEVWAADPETAALRHQLARRRQLVKQRTREKNQVHAVLQRNLKGRPPASDLFGAEGREWLAQQQLPRHEREMVEACLRHIDFLDSEVAALDRRVGEHVLGSPEMRRLMQLPGVGPTTAATLMAAIGDVSRFPSPRHLVGYLGLNPKVRQSGDARQGGEAATLQTLEPQYHQGAGYRSVTENRFTGINHDYIRDDSHAFILREPSRCIDCGRCAQVCAEVVGAACYDFMRIGFDTLVTTPLDMSLNDTPCVTCGRCAETCPTGALMPKPRVLEKYEVDESRCILCGICVDVHRVNSPIAGESSGARCWSSDRSRSTIPGRPRRRGRHRGCAGATAGGRR